MTTFAEVMARRMGSQAGQPLVTYYDLATGERVELSVTTYANWVAKTASLLAEEHGLERGASLRVDLPVHWLGTVFVGAAWTIGMTLTQRDEPDAAVCGPTHLQHWASYSTRIPVLACSLLPLGARFADPLPPRVHDFGTQVWSQPDVFTPWDPPDGHDLATDETSHDELWSRAAAGSPPPGDGRLLATANPASPSGLAAFTGPLVGGGSLVLVSGAPADPADAALARVYDAERCTAHFSPPGRTP